MGLGEQRLERSLELGRSLVGDLDLELVLKRVLEAGAGADRGALCGAGVLDSRREELEQFLTVGIDEPTRRELGDLPRGHGVLGVLIHDPRPLRLSVGRGSPAVLRLPARAPADGELSACRYGSRGDVFGNLYLTDKQGAEEFDEADEQALVALADWAAIAIANARRHGGVRGQRDQLVRAVRAFETSEEIGRALAGETRLDRVLELIVKARARWSRRA